MLCFYVFNNSNSKRKRFLTFHKDQRGNNCHYIKCPFHNCIYFYLKIMTGYYGSIIIRKPMISSWASGI